MKEGGCIDYRSRAAAKPDGTALHVGDRVVSVLSGWRGGQSKNILGFHFPKHLLERKG